MLILEVALIFITGIYFVTLVYLIKGWNAIPEFTLEYILPQTKFSIIIAFRNESKHLQPLLKSISALNYPNHLFEIIFINDHSDDDSVEIIERFISKLKKTTNTLAPQIVILQNGFNRLAPKKEAITLGISKARHPWIVCTDADCVLPKSWLKTFDAFIQKKDSDFIAAPVIYRKENKFLNHFQIMDFLSLQTATGGGFGLSRPFLCNGANLVYKKSLFNKLNGFDGNHTIASGDDIFLLEKAIDCEDIRMHYLKCKHSCVETYAQNSLKDLIAQRKRWASKTTAYSNNFGKRIGILIFVMNATWIITFSLALLHIFPWHNWIFVTIIKYCIDGLMIYKSAKFMDQKSVFKSYGIAGLLYPFFSVGIAVLSIFCAYDWKGRRYRQ